MKSAEDIIIQQKTGKIIIEKKEKEILEKSLEILSTIYYDAVHSFEIPNTFASSAISEKVAKDLIFNKSMELKYLSKWINVKMFLTSVGKSIKGRKSRKGRQSGKGRKGR